MLGRNKSAAMEVTPHGSLPLKLKCLVRACQFLGIWCFRISSSPTKVVANVPLLLWVIFMMTFQVNGVVYSSITLIEVHLGFSIGILLFVISSIFLLVGQISFVAHCSTLCQILSACDADAWPKVKESLVEKIMTLAFYCSYMLLVPLTCIYKQDGSVNQLLSAVFLCLTMSSTMVIIMIFREMLNIAASKVSLDSLCLNEHHLQAGAAEWGPLLYSIERKILEVSAAVYCILCIVWKVFVYSHIFLLLLIPSILFS